MRHTYALFDFDGTLIRGDSILLLCAYAHRKKLVGAGYMLAALWTAVRYGLRLLPPERAKERALRFLAGKPKAEADALVADFYATVLAPRLRPDGVKAVRDHAAAGHRTLLVSASSAFYLAPVREALGFDDVIATRWDADANGVLTGRVCGENCRGVQKALRLAEYLAAKGDRLDFETSAAYGDSYGDLPMLRLCRHPVAVNPKRKLWRALRHDADARRVTWAEPEKAAAARR
jgi:HAD superfamily hydrolase (TIGR01490 family)